MDSKAQMLDTFRVALTPHRRQPMVGCAMSCHTCTLGVMKTIKSVHIQWKLITYRNKVRITNCKMIPGQHFHLFGQGSIFLVVEIKISVIGNPRQFCAITKMSQSQFPTCIVNQMVTNYELHTSLLV